jgi:hypothetical protein
VAETSEKGGHMKFVHWACSLTIAIGLGCQRQAGVSPGTPGEIRHGMLPLADVRVTLHRIKDNDVEVVGFGVSDQQGKFGLFQERAVGPLWLQPAEYSITLQSEGAVPFSWPTKYQDAKTTPLRQIWSEGDRKLELDVPNPSPSLGAPGSLWK